MKIYIIVNSQEEKIAQAEVIRLVGVEPTIKEQILICELSKEQLQIVILHMQSCIRILLALGQNEKYADLTLSKPIDLQSEYTFVTEVENVRGQDNRIEIAKSVTPKFLSLYPGGSIHYKDPKYRVTVFYNSHTYYIGLDFSHEELSKRAYRVFAHHASFKGDLAYTLLHYCNITMNSSPLFCYMKDGTLPIELAFMQSGLAVRELDELIPLLKFISSVTPNDTKKIEGFDSSKRNYVAARKNASIAGVNNFIAFHKYELEEVDVRYEKESMSHIVFQITSKDENELNEIYYQSSFVLSSDGLLCFISREGWDIMIPETFELVSTKNVLRGESVHKVTVLKKK